MKITKINLWFKKQASSIIKYRWFIIAVFLIAVVTSFFGLKKMVVEYDNKGYFLPDDPMIVMGDEFKEIFGNDYYVGVLLESESLFTKENLELLRELGNELIDSVPYADKLTSLTDVEFTVGTEYGMEIIQVVPEVIPSDKVSLEKIREKAFSKKNFAEKLVSKDGKLSWIMMKLLPFPEYHREKGKKMPEIIVGEKVEQIITQKKYESLHPRGTGMPYLNYKKAAFFDKESPRVMGLALLFAFIFLAFSTRSIRGVIVPIISAIGSVIIVFGAVGFLNIPIDGSILSIPILLSIAISIGYSIHIFTFYKRHKRETGKRKESVLFAMEETGWPLLFTGLTTISALLSFLIIPVKSIRLIGLITASNVAVILFIVMFLMPALLSFGKDTKPKNNIKRDSKTWLAFRLEKFGNWILNYPKTIIITSIALAIVLIYGMTKVEAAFDVEKTMGRKIPYVKNLLEISETELGSLYSYDLMIEFPEEGLAKQPENLKKLNELSKYVETFELTKRTSSVLDVIKDMNQVLNEDIEVFYTIPDNREQVAQILLLYENAGGTEAEYWIDYEYKRLRLMAELNSFNSKEAKRENELVQQKAEELFPNAQRISVVGSLPQFVTVMDYVVKGQVNSFMIAIGIIAILLMFVFGSIKTGLIGLIPNIAPALTVGGIMGFFDIPLDMMTVTIIPMILGLAVDDTIHFFNHGRLEFERTGNYRKSIIKTFGTVGVALVLTTLILSANFLAYTTSVANMFINLGVLAAAGMVSALLADFFITPVLFKQFRIFGKEHKPVGSLQSAVFNR